MTPGILFAHNLTALGLPGELFLQKYWDWEVTLPDGVTIRGITEEGLLSCGYKSAAERQWVGSPKDGERGDDLSLGKSTRGCKKKASKSPLGEWDSRTSHNNLEGHDNTVSIEHRIRNAQVSNRS